MRTQKYNIKKERKFKDAAFAAESRHFCEAGHM